MTMKKIKIVFILLCSILLTGCDDFLTTPPLDEIPSTEWWKSKEQVQLMVNECYVAIYSNPDSHIIAFRDGWSDNAMWKSNYTIGNGSFTAYDAKVKAEWKYKDIAKLNYVLEGMEKTKEFLTADEYAHWTAEIRFIRAFVYYEMLFYFGDIPLITKVLTIEESRETSRQPRTEVLNFILTELNEALEDIKKNPSTETGRINEDVINGYLARVYLYEKDYDKVLMHTKAIMNSGRYGLYRAYDNDAEKNSYEELFRPASDGNNNEVIFEKQWSYPLKTTYLNHDLSPMGSIYKGWLRMLPVQNMVDEYECIEGHSIHDCEALGCPYAVKRSEFSKDGGYGEYEYRDPRLKSTIITPGWEWKVNGVVTYVYDLENPNSVDNLSKEPKSSGFLLTKWVDLEGKEEDGWLTHKNMTIIRYADIMLMRAEALIEKNENLDEAVTLINEIRDRARMPKNVQVTNQDDLREKLRHERRIELAFEGLRYFDIIRWRICDKVKNGDVYGFARMTDSGKRENLFMEKRVWKDHMYLWPIPQDARDLNDNLTQNQGW